MSGGKAKKEAYVERLLGYLDKYPRILFVLCDNIGSNHMQRIRISLRGQATLLMGKNTLIRRAIREACKPDENGNVRGQKKWLSLLPHISQNVGLVFTDQELSTVSKLIQATTVPASAKVGAVAPNDVIVPKGQTTLEPTKTSFFAALDIATKITKGSIELLSDVSLIKKGEKVGNSQAQLLKMLNISPFQYGMVSITVYDDGSVYPAEYLNFSESDLLDRFFSGVSNVASIALATNTPTSASFPHVVLNAYKNLLAVVASTDYVFPLAENLKKMLENPDAFVTAPVAKEEKTEEKEEKKPAAKEESESEDALGDIFGF